MKAVRVSLGVLVVATGGALVACSSGHSNSSDGPTTSTLGAVKNDGQIMQAMITFNTGEVTEGQLGKQRALAQPVRLYADGLIWDHLNVNTALLEHAQDVGITLEESLLSRQLASDSSQTVAAISGLAGAEFEQAFAAAQVKKNQDWIGTIEGTLFPTASHPDVKAELTSAKELAQRNITAGQALAPGGAPADAATD